MNFDNFSIRPMAPEDPEDFFRLIERNRPRLQDFLAGTVSRTKTLEDTKQYVTEIIKKAEQRVYIPFLVVNNENNLPIGFIDIKNIDWNIPKGELGCFVDEAYSGKGVSTKVLAVFTDFCFSNFGFKKLFLRTHAGNLAARKVAGNCGFEVEGIIRRDYKTTAGELVDLIYYGKLSPA